MKKISLFIILGILFMGNVCYSQNSDVEVAEYENKYETKAELFINNCFYSKTETFNKAWQGDLNFYAKVTTNLITQEKVGYIFFETETGTYGAASSLGYLDMDEVDDLLRALNGVLEVSKEKSEAKSYVINYVTHGGLDFTFYFDKNGKIVISKEWNYINRYGTKVSSRVTNESMSTKDMVKFISELEKTRSIVLENLK